MVMTLSRGCGLPPNPRCGLPRSRASLITPLGGNTTDWRAGCGRSARPVRREGECFLALSLPLSNLCVARGPLFVGSVVISNGQRTTDNGRSMRKKMLGFRKLAQALWQYLREVSGENDYARYRARALGQKVEPMSPGEFY